MWILDLFNGWSLDEVIQLNEYAFSAVMVLAAAVSVGSVDINR